MLVDFSHHFLLIVLFLTGLGAGTIDAIAGGGGLISLPMLLSVGVPPHIALGTNKLQSSIGTSVATWTYHRQGWFSFHNVGLGLLFGFIGASLGALTGQIISGEILKIIIPILLLIILIYTLFSPRLGSYDRHPRLSEFWFYTIFGFSLGFYDGFLGPGAGSFWVFLLTFFLGYNLTKATAYTKIFNLNSNLVALGCFALGHNVDYKIGLCMAAGQLIGGRLGAFLAIKNGAKLIRPIFVLVVSATIMTLFYKNYAVHMNMTMKMLVIIFGFLSVGMIYLWNEKKSQMSINT